MDHCRWFYNRRSASFGGALPRHASSQQAHNGGSQSVTRREGHKRLAERVCCARRPSCRSSDSGGGGDLLATPPVASTQRRACAASSSSRRLDCCWRTPVPNTPSPCRSPYAAPGFCPLTVQCLLIESEMQTAKATRQPLNRTQLKCSIQMQLAS